MSTLQCIETYIDNEKNHYGCFLIEPLEAGQGITLGNALRRTLLSDLTGYAIVGVRINNLEHEFTNLPGLREDPLEILLNLKEIIFRTSFSFQKNFPQPKLTGLLKAKGPVILTAGMFQLPSRHIQIVNPDQYIGTIVDTSQIYMEIDIESGKGYQLVDEYRKKKVQNKNNSTLLIDALFMPVKRISYKIQLIHDTQGNIKESLLFEIWTNGSITPKRSIQEGLKILMDLIYPLYITPPFSSISSDFSKNYFSKEN
jgi:DNA-directed RNA polymerase subunit alpha